MALKTWYERWHRNRQERSRDRKPLGITDSRSGPSQHRSPASSWIVLNRLAEKLASQGIDAVSNLDVQLTSTLIWAFGLD
jgi:hypothetical protein